MTSAATGRPRAQQDRSRRTEQQILDAALTVLSESGADGLTTGSVSRAAGVSVGSIYRRFGDKEQLLLATQAELLRLVEDQMVDAAMAMTPEVAADPRATVTHMTTAMGRGFQLNADALHAIMLVGLQNPAVYEAGHHTSVRAGRLFALSMLRHRESIRQPDPEAAVDFAYRLIHAACSHRVLEGEALESDLPRTWDQMLAELAKANVAYLLG
ncbi:MAG: helix-turn-helix domain-containing protein [Microbacterium sp.]|uniref:TetR/AcrR family transcriptional regulator n=1 Tax=Microbacterium sp. TaxID=51671 RepID=UPI0039E67615